MKKFTNPFTKKKAQFAAIKVVATTLGTAHFILQGAADIVKDTEAVVISKIDNNISYDDAKEVRDLLYQKNASRVKIAYYGSLVKLNEVNDKLATSISKMQVRIQDNTIEAITTEAQTA